ncbi:MAG TPA: cytochrome c [Candidatus Dormibacteraeota bacterium]|nr:cytochrome c [Candidatus Dormibacteraeota bacterium]
MKMWKTGLLLLLVMMIGALVYGIRVIRRGFSTREAPSALETYVARTIRDLSIPRDAKQEENPWIGSATPAVMADARAHWADHCATCHANDGSGNTEMGDGLYPKPPDMRLPATQNLTDGELYYIIRNGVRLTGMPAWGDPHLDQDDESWQLVLFIRHLPKMTAEEAKEMEKLNPKSQMDDLEIETSGEIKSTGQKPENHQHQ